MGTEKMECKNMLKYTPSRVHENHFNNTINLIVHLLICFSSDLTLALGAVAKKKPSQSGTFLLTKNKKTKEDSLFGK